jgi:hypothetical protein
MKNANPKLEARNPKQIRISKIPMTKTSNQFQLNCLEHSNFGFVSDFVLRISDFFSKL